MWDRTQIPCVFPSHIPLTMPVESSWPQQAHTCDRKCTIAHALIPPACRAAAWSCVLAKTGKPRRRGEDRKKLMIEARISWKQFFNAKLVHAGGAKKTKEGCGCFPLPGRSLPRLVHGALGAERKQGCALTVRAWQETPALILTASNLPASDKQLAAAGGSADTEMETQINPSSPFFLIYFV